MTKLNGFQSLKLKIALKNYEYHIPNNVFISIQLYFRLRFSLVNAMNIYLRLLKYLFVCSIKALWRTNIFMMRLLYL